LVPAFTSPVRSLIETPPPAVLICALNCAGTVIVYFPSVRCDPNHQCWFLLLPREEMVTVLPSWVMVTGCSRRNCSSSDLLRRETLRSTSIVTSPVAFVVISTEPKSTSMTSLPPGFAAKLLLNCSSVSAPTAKQLASSTAKYDFIALLVLGFNRLA